MSLQDIKIARSVNPNELPTLGCVQGNLKQRAVLGWNHTNDTPQGLESGEIWCWNADGKLQVFDQSYNRSHAAGVVRDCGVANFTMVRMIHPYWCPDGRVPQDMNWSDKKHLRDRYDALVRDDGLQGFAALGGAVDDSDPDGLLLNPRKRRRARVLKRMRRADKVERSDLKDMLRTVWGIEANPRQQSSSTTIGDDMSDGKKPRGIQSTAVSRTGIYTNDWSLMPRAKIEDVQGPEVIDDEDDDVVGRFIAEVEGAAGTRQDPVELD